MNKLSKIKFLCIVDCIHYYRFQIVEIQYLVDVKYIKYTKKTHVMRVI
jgi:hypothetical protein